MPGGKPVDLRVTPRTSLEKNDLKSQDSSDK